MFIWVRAGDADDYHHFDSVAEAAEYLREQPCGLLERSGKFGVVDDERYTGNNYISLFWGDNAAQASRDVSDDELAELNQIMKQTLRIRAECHSDDHHVETKFDATAYFEQASDDELLDLAKCDFGGDYAADAVAQFFDDRTTKRLFDYLATDPTMGRETVGFECHVDENDAMEWLAANRPELWRKVADR